MDSVAGWGIRLSVTANEVHYYLISLRLAPDETRAIDLRALRDAQVADFEGNRIPAEATDGAVNWNRLDSVAVTGRVVVISRDGAITSNYDCCVCSCPTSYVALNVNDPTSFGMSVGDFRQTTLEAGYGNCNVASYYYDVTSSATWQSNNTSIVTVSVGDVHGVGPGSTGVVAFYTGTMYIYNDYLHSCPAQNVQRGAGATPTVVDTFNVEYSSYIPVDHVVGPSSCGYFYPNDTTLIYMGDAFRGTIRTKEFDNVGPDTQRSSGFTQDTGLTKNYGYGSPANGSTLSSADEDGVRYDCHLWNNTDQAPRNFSYDVSWPQTHQGRIHYSGSAANPLEDPSATITWDMSTTIDTSNPSGPTAAISFNHTCYPAHQIKVNGQVVYLYTPLQNDPGYLFDCLYRHLNPVTGQTSPQSVPTH